MSLGGDGHQKEAVAMVCDSSYSTTDFGQAIEASCIGDPRGPHATIGDFWLF